MSKEDTVDGSDACPEDQLRVANAIARDDLLGIAWSWLAALSRRLEATDANRAVGWARLIQRLGAEAGDSEEGLLESSVLGGVMHGFAPRTQEQWQFARKTFDPQTYADIRTWAGMPPEDPADDEPRAPTGAAT